MKELSSRERMVRALGFQEVDHIPCCFMSFTALRKRCREDLFELVKAERQLGLDSMLFIPTTPRPQRPEHPELRGLAVHFAPEVAVREWRETAAGDSDILHKEYSTPKGKLSTQVRLSEDWPHGDHIPFVDDFQVPRALKPLVTQAADLDALRYFLLPPTAVDRAQFRQHAEVARVFAKEQGVLLAGGWGVGMDMAVWLCGMQSLMLLAMDEPDFVTALLEMIHVWNLKRMEVVLSAPVDLFIRRAWYEGCDFVTPGFFRTSILPRLKAEVDLAHESGAKFGYICSSGIGPMLDSYLESGIDVLIGIDPIQGTHTNLQHVKQKAGERLCLWGGVSGAITVESGTAADVRAAVQNAITLLGPRGLILSPVDNITIDEPRTWENINVCIEAWRHFWNP